MHDAPTKLLTARELAPLIGVAASTLWGLAARGVIPCHRVGRSVRFNLEEVKAATHREPVTVPPREAIESLAAYDVRRALAGKGGRR